MKSIKSHIQVLSVLIAIFIFTGIAYSTEATISITEDEEDVILNVNATFTSYTVCDPDDSSNCITDDSGTIYIYHDDFEIANLGGNGSITWSDTLDCGSMQQGSNRFTVKAIDFEGRIVTEETELEIDNTPLVAITDTGSTEGAFDLNGTCSFIEYLDGSEGIISISIDGFPQGQKEYEGTDINWSYSDITGQMLHAGTLPQGEHSIMVRAVAANNTYSEEILSFTIDNTPVVSVVSPGTVEGSFDIIGTVVFKENAVGSEGIVYIYIDEILYAEKQYEGMNIHWSYSDINGQMLDAASFDPTKHTIAVRAVSANGAISNYATGAFIVENE